MTVQQIQDLIGEPYRCSKVGDYVRIRTPFYYPDGDLIDVFCIHHDGDIHALTDLGEAVRWIKDLAWLTPDTKETLQDVCSPYNVDFYYSHLQLKLSPDQQLRVAVTELAEVIMKILNLFCPGD